MKTVTKAQIIVKWTDENWEWHEARFHNIWAFAQFLKVKKDLAHELDYIPKSERNRGRF